MAPEDCRGMVSVVRGVEVGMVEEGAIVEVAIVETGRVEVSIVEVGIDGGTMLDAEWVS
jgi:hypothetical protein